MSGFHSTLAASMSISRVEAAHLRCHACRKETPAGIDDHNPTLPLSCQHCGEALPDNHVLLANLVLARRETDQLAHTVGVLLRTLAIVARNHPHALREPVEALERAVDLIVLDSNAPAVAQLHAGVFSSAKKRNDGIAAAKSRK